jgi:hypothetical protein
MSKCGKCNNRNCACFLTDDGTTTLVKGIGTSYSPYQVRPRIPADYRPVGYADRPDTGQLITLNTDTPITFQRGRAQAFNDMWDPLAPTRLTISTTGLYLVGGMAAQEGASASQVWTVWISKNGVPGTALVKRTTTAINTTQDLMCSVVTAVELTAGDYLELYVRSTRTGNTPSGFWDPCPNLWANWMGV